MSALPAFHLTDTPLARGTTLVEASAGTGKTYAITALFIRLILEQDLAVNEILTVTYTEAATAELRQRVREALATALRAFETGASETPFLQTLVNSHRAETGEMTARLGRALRGFDEAAIYTIHGFCRRTLRDRAFESGLLFDTELATDNAELLQEIADDFWRRHFYEAGSTSVNFALKNELQPDQFLRFIKTLANYPLLEFLSPVDDRDFAALTAALENEFAAAKKIWLTDRENIKPLFGSATKWGNQPYNDDAKMAALFDELGFCFSEKNSAYEVLASLDQFRSTALENGKSKRAKEPMPAHPFFEICERLGQTEQLWLVGLKLELARWTKAELPARKARRKIQHFDDLLMQLHTALAGDGGAALAGSLRQLYRAALIDEFQDTDPVQYDIFRRAFGGGATFLFLIGDPKQAIYGFRGADIFTYLEAAGEADRQFTLGENWRSESGLVTAVNKIFSAAPNAFVFDRIHFQEAVPKGDADQKPLRAGGEKPPPFRFWFWPRAGGDITAKRAEEILPATIAAEISRLLNGDFTLGHRRLKPEDIAVLVMQNRQAALMQTALAQLNIPSVLYTDASLFQSPEAAEFLRVLAGIARPGDERLVRAALATELFGVTGGELATFTEAAWQARLERFHEFREVWELRGFFPMFRRWLQLEQIRPRLLALPDGERRLTNVLHLGEVLHQTEAELRLGTGGLVKWLAEKMDPAAATAEEHQLRLERDDNAVRLVTVHKSKGLQYPVVFSAFAWKNSELKHGGEEQVFFHDPARGQKLVRDLGPEISDAHKNLAMEERLAENVRLLYVALTRARNRCYFVWGGLKNADTSAPAWLLHSPPVAGGISPVAALEANFKSLTDAKMLADLEALQNKAAGQIHLENLPESVGEPFRPADESAAPLACRAFTGSIRRDWVISSFTYFRAGQTEELPDYDNVARASEDELPAAGFFAFPRGAKAGTCLHEILQQLDFTAAPEIFAAPVASRLLAHGLAGDGRVEAVCAALARVIQTPLDGKIPELKLARLAPAARLNELEFYFPITSVSSAALSKFFAARGWPAPLPDHRLALEAVNGFLKGFIDLVFEFAGKYYLVDWKSNWLGNRAEDYSPAALRAEMQREDYFLQYHLYALALHKYLGQRVPDYRYEKHFGGVFYIFLRGVDPAKPDCGIFRDRPALKIITELDALLGGQ